MKNIIKIFFLSIAIVGFSVNANAQHPAKRKAVKKAVVANHIAHKHQVDKHRSAKYLKRTSLAIMKARNQVKKGGNYTGDLAKAYHYQKFARMKFRKGQYHRAVYHSRRARMHAWKAIQANKGTLSSDIKDEAGDTELFTENVSDEELDKEFKAEMGDVKFDDQSLFDMPLDEIEINEDDMKPESGN